MGSVVWVVSQLTWVESQMSITDIKSCWRTKLTKDILSHRWWWWITSRESLWCPDWCPCQQAPCLTCFWGPWLCPGVHIGSWWELLGRKHDLGHQWPTAATSGYKLISGRKGNDRKEARGDINRVKINQNIGQIRFPEVCWRSQLTLTSHLFPPFGDPLILPSQPHHPDHLQRLANYQSSVHQIWKLFHHSWDNWCLAMISRYAETSFRAHPSRPQQFSFSMISSSFSFFILLLLCQKI